jgi:hypothetical protein
VSFFTLAAALEEEPPVGAELSTQPVSVSAVTATRAVTGARVRVRMGGGAFFSVQ